MGPQRERKKKLRSPREREKNRQKPTHILSGTAEEKKDKEEKEDNAQVLVVKVKKMDFTVREDQT